MAAATSASRSDMGRAADAATGMFRHGKLSSLPPCPARPAARHPRPACPAGSPPACPAGSPPCPPACLQAAKSKQPQKAVEIFEAMAAVDVQPNTFSYSALISALARAGRWQVGGGGGVGSGLLARAGCWAAWGGGGAEVVCGGWGRCPTGATRCSCCYLAAAAAAAAHTWRTRWLPQPPGLPWPAGGGGLFSGAGRQGAALP